MIQRRSGEHLASGHRVPAGGSGKAQAGGLFPAKAASQPDCDFRKKDRRKRKEEARCLGANQMSPTGAFQAVPGNVAQVESTLMGAD